ncbi:MAG: phosphatidate cytidylyltransferase [Alphaproteobacteria bacterium]|nr:phosphatidate cytidylyltransferase [Alphaproteobacteria bacterium]
MALGMSDNLIKRIVSALLLLPIALYPIYAGGIWFWALLSLGGVLMALEWGALTLPDTGKLIRLSLPFGALFLLLSFIGSGLGGGEQSISGMGILFVAGCLFSKVRPVPGWWFAGIGYVTLPLIALSVLREASSILVLWVFLIVWATDVGGYFAGKGIGGPKLAPRISPKKTWAGLLGGMALAALVSIGMAEVLGLHEYNWHFAAALAAWAQVGDLVESGIKRHFNVKDSGGLIPGHGGLLDRVDGLVFVAPAVALILYYMPLFGVELTG